MKKLLSLLVFLPIAIILIVLSVANRHPVVFNFDPINPEVPFLAVTLPFFLYLFIAVLLGMVIGSMATWFTQGKHRKMAREQKRDAVKWQHEAQEQKQRANQAVDQITAGQNPHDAQDNTSLNTPVAITNNAA